MLGSHPWARRGLERVARKALLGALTVAALLAFTSVAAAAPRTFYVDCTGGSDASAGLGTGSQAWRSLGKASAAALAPGDKLLLKRTCAWTGPLTLRSKGTAASPIAVGAYGTGAAPVIQNYYNNVEIYGSYLIIEDIVTRADVPMYDPTCGNAPAGWRVGFRFYNGSAYNTLRWSTATGLYNGIRVEQGSHHNKITGNHLIKNNMKDEHQGSDAGVIGIALFGDDNDVSYNDISGSDACSQLYQRDGDAVTIFGGQRNVIHHNTAVDNNDFIELGNPRSSNTTIAYNKVYSSLKIANFLVTRGAGDKAWGPIYGTKAYNNSVYLTGAQSYAVQCTGGCNASVLSLRNNIIVSQDRIGYADGPFDEGNNIFWQPQGNPKVYWTMSSTSRKINPGWVNMATRDFHLAAGSPAIDKASMVAYNAGFRSRPLRRRRAARGGA